MLDSAVADILPIALTMQRLGDGGAVGHSHTGAVGPAGDAVRSMDEMTICHFPTAAAAHWMIQQCPHRRHPCPHPSHHSLRVGIRHSHSTMTGSLRVAVGHSHTVAAGLGVAVGDGGAAVGGIGGGRRDGSCHQLAACV